MTQKQPRSRRRTQTDPRAAADTTDPLSERLRLPRAKDGAAVQIDSDTLLACSLFHQGEFSRAIETAENGVDLYDPQQHAGLIATYGENPAVACHGWAALSLWCLGYADQALERVKLSLELAGHPDLVFSLAGAKVRAANVTSFAGTRLRPSTGLPRPPLLPKSTDICTRVRLREPSRAGRSR